MNIMDICGLNVFTTEFQNNFVLVFVLMPAESGNFRLRPLK
jgi:hypothetical protein